MAQKFITRSMVKQLRRDCEEALQAVAERHGLQLRQRKSVTFAPDKCPVPLEFVVVHTTEEGDEITPEARTFQQRAMVYGLEPDWLHQSFDLNGTRVKITGLNTRARKYPVQVRAEDGKRYKVPANTVKACMAIEIMKREGSL